MAFVNACLTYFGSRVEIENVLCDQLTINLIMAYIFIPIAWVMGVEWQDCREVSLAGIDCSDYYYSYLHGEKNKEKAL